MYNRDIRMLAHLNKMDQTFKQISFAFLSDRSLDDFHNRVRFDLHEFEEFYAQTLIDVLTVKAYLEADGKESYLTPIKADIQLLHTFANHCFKWIDAVEQLMNIENDVLKKNNWKLPLSKADLITVDRKATTPFSFVDHYAHLSYLDKEKAVFCHLAMDNGIILNKLKQVIVVCHNEIVNYMDYLSVAAQKSCLSHVQENKNNKQANMEIGYYLYREIIDFDDIHIVPELILKVVKNAS